MVETVVSMGLPVDERLEIKKNRLMPEETSDNMKRIGIVTGTHGDELEGQFVCYELNQRIQKHPEYLHGIVDIYPAFTNKKSPLPRTTSWTTGKKSSTSYSLLHLDLRHIFKGKSDVLFIIYRHIIQQHIPHILMEFCDSFRLILFCKKHFALSLLYLLFINCVTHQIPKNPPSHQNAPLSFFE